ncbi:MAG: O-antigen ligase family protein [Candidatus Sumerlaeota bacterium]|nr:O-antigen ligase family protein [Candidatus Sumerlaeota bacterium]
MTSPDPHPSPSQPSPLAAARRRLALLYLFVILAGTPFVIRLAFQRPTVSQTFFFEMAALLGAFAYSAGRLSWAIGAPPRDPLRPWIVLYGVALAAAAALGPQRGYSFTHGIFPLSGMALYFIAFAYPWNRRDAARLVLLLSAAAFVASAYGLMQGLNLDILPYAGEARVGKMKLVSVFGHPNYAASYLGPIFVLMLSLRFWRVRLRPPAPLLTAVVGCAALLVCAVLGAYRHSMALPLMGIALGAGAAAWGFGRFQALSIVVVGAFLLAAGARGIWLAIGVLFLAVAALFIARSRWTARAWMRLAAAVGVGLAAFAGVCAFTPFGHYLARRLTETQSIASRLYSFTIAAEMIRERPWLGWGYASFDAQYFNQVVELQKQKGSEVFNPLLIATQGKPPQFVHNDLLEIAVDAGLFGVFAFLAILVAYGAAAWRSIRSQADAREAALRAAVLLAVACVILDGLFSFPLRLPCSAALFWGLLAIGARLAAGADEAD